MWPVFCLTYVLTGGLPRAESPAVAAPAAAAARQDWVLMRQLITDGADVNAVRPDGMAAIHWAVWFEQPEQVSWLVEHGSSVTESNRFGVTPLTIAASNGHDRIIARLLAAGADANGAGPGGDTPLMLACRNGRLVAVAELLQHGAAVDSKNTDQQTAIMWAAAAGHADVVSLLLSAGAEFRQPLDSGMTPLFFAVREGHVDVVDQLLQAGADVNGVMEPKKRGKRTARTGTTPLQLALENGHFELVESLLNAGADPNDQRSGFAPLHAISWVRRPNYGDDLDGDPPPIGSGSISSLQCVRILVRHGADVNARLQEGRGGKGRLNHKGATPFLFAADTADLPLMTLLLELGADPAIPNVDNCPPLLAAAGVGTMAPGEEAGTEDEAIAAVQLLLDQGADINAVDNNGETAMHGAAYKNLPGMVQFLSANGASIAIWDRPDRYGWTPLTIARGYRPGNFKPSAETVAALTAVMRAAGIEPPPDTQAEPPTNSEYQTPAAKTPAVPNAGGNARDTK